MAETMHRLTRDEARRIIVRAQLLDGERPGDVVEVAEGLGRIKIDPTAVITPSEHTIAWSRVGWGYEPGQLKKAVEDDRALFEYDAMFRPASMLPALLPTLNRDFLHAATRQWIEANEQFRTDILDRLRAEGPLPPSSIPDTSQVAHRSEAGWYGPSQVPRMLEVLAAAGDVAVVRREGRTRVWDLAERVYAGVTSPFSPDEAQLELQRLRLQAAGLAKTRSPWSKVGTAGEAATVEGSAWKFRVDPAAIAALDEDRGGRAAILNPYDGLLFDRPRLAEVFEFTYVLEQFKPKAQRVYGYFAHPILVGDRFVAMLDATHDRDAGTLRVDAVHELVELDPEEREMIRAEIAELAEWLGVDVSGAGA